MGSLMAPQIENKAILALDLGSVIGWAIRTQKNATESGFEAFKGHRFEGGGMRFLRFRNFLDRTRHRYGDIGAVYFEEVRRHLGVDAAHVYGGFLATLTAWCELHGIPYQGVPVGTIKKHATGSGRATKAEMIAAMKKAGHHPANDNEADALALLMLVLNDRQ